MLLFKGSLQRVDLEGAGLVPLMVFALDGVDRRLRRLAIGGGLRFGPAARLLVHDAFLGNAGGMPRCVAGRPARFTRARHHDEPAEEEAGEKAKSDLPELQERQHQFSPDTQSSASPRRCASPISRRLTRPFTTWPPARLKAVCASQASR